MLHTGPFADSVAAAAAAAASADRRTQPPSSSAGGVPPPPNSALTLTVPPSTPLSPPPILHSRGLSPGGLIGAAGAADGGDSDNDGGANLSAVQQPILTGVTFGGGAPRAGGLGLRVPPRGSPPGSSPESAGQGGGWRQMQRQQHDYQFGGRGGTMNTNPSAPPSKRRRTMMEAFGDLSLSQRRGMAGLDLATSSPAAGMAGGSRPGLGLGLGDGAPGSTRSLGGFGAGGWQAWQQEEEDQTALPFLQGNGGSGVNVIPNRPSRPSPIAGLNGAGPMHHIGFSSVASHSSPGLTRRSVGATPSEETIEEDSEDPLDLTRTGSDDADGFGFAPGFGMSPCNIAAPTALPPKPDPNVIRVTSLDTESASETASEMDEGAFDGLVPLIAPSSTSEKPKNPVDAKIEALIRRDRMRAMIQAKLEAEGKKPPVNGDIGGSSQGKTRDDFDYQGTFTTAGSATWRKPDAAMGGTPATAAAETSITPLSIPAAIPSRHPSSATEIVRPPAASTAAASATATMPPPAPNAANSSNPNSGAAKIAPGMQRGRSTERSSRGSRSRSLPRQYMKMAPQPRKSRDVSMTSASSAATSGGSGASDMDL